jgi:hypothetical protein
VALSTLGAYDALRQRLREWLYDGEDKASVCQTQIEISACFAPLLGWVLSWWHSATLALALDATLLKDQTVALVISVLYRGCAIPVAWTILPANRKGAWMPHILRMLRQLHQVVPASMDVLVLADRGLWSPRLWHRLRRLHWHPLLRLQGTITFAPDGQARQLARTLVPGAGWAWVGRGRAFCHHRLRGTLLVVWEEGQAEPWILLTDRRPQDVGPAWYGLRVWIELGFRALKGIGWQWQRTRRTDPTRIARHWLVLAVATLWVMAYGTRVEDAEQRHLPPARLLSPPEPRAADTKAAAPHRRVSLFLQGWSWLQKTLSHGYLWTRLWLMPEPWPTPVSNIHIISHGKT